jgi:hypothetical protein
MYCVTCDKNGLTTFCFLDLEIDQRNGYAFVLLRVTDHWQTLTPRCGNDRKSYTGVLISP